MKLQRYFNPVETHVGCGALDLLPGLLGQRRARLVTFPEARALGLVARVRTLLGDRLSGDAIEDVRPNPDVADLGPLYDRFWADADPVETIVAVGGGSAIDTAKVLMVGTESRRFEGLVGALSSARPFVPTAVKTLIAVPTTAGTGSEVTPWATIWDRETQAKHSLHLDQTWPTCAVVDPELMVSLPRSVTLQSGLDALSHALESIWNVNANPVSDTFAVAAARETMATLPELLARLDDLELRRRMAVAALKAGLAFSNTRTALAHSISYEMTLRHGLPHGIACSFSLPMVLERAIGTSADRDAVLTLALGGPLSGASRRLADFLEGLGVGTAFADYGVDDAEAGRMVTHALTGARGRNFIGALRTPAAVR